MSRAVAQSLFPDIIGEKFVGPLPQSVQFGTNADMVHAFRGVYFQHGRRIVDLTYGSEGGWWKRHRPDGLVVSVHDFTDLPHLAGDFDTVCYDPPYVQSGGAPTSTRALDLRDRFGINEPNRTEAELFALIVAGANEAARITAPDGFLCLKAMDFTASARFNDWTYRIHAHMTGRGMVLHDEVIVNGGSGPGGHNIETPKRARRAHSKLLVFTWGNR